MIEGLVIHQLLENERQINRKIRDKPGFAAGFAFGFARFDAGLAVSSSNALSCAS